MNIAILLYGFVSGILVSIPAGPITVLIVYNSLLKKIGVALKYLFALVAGELLYVMLFVYGVDKYLLGNLWLKNSILLGGSCFLILIGIAEIRKCITNKKKNLTDKTKASNLAFSSGLLITLTNPGIFLIMAGIVAAAKNFFNESLVDMHLLSLLLCVELGCTMWFLLIIYIMVKIPEKYSQKFLVYLQMGGALILIGFGSFNIISLLA